MYTPLIDECSVLCQSHTVSREGMQVNGLRHKKEDMKSHLLRHDNTLDVEYKRRIAPARRPRSTTRIAPKHCFTITREKYICNLHHGWTSRVIDAKVCTSLCTHGSRCTYICFHGVKRVHERFKNVSYETERSGNWIRQCKIRSRGDRILQAA